MSMTMKVLALLVLMFHSLMWGAITYLAFNLNIQVIPWITLVLFVFSFSAFVGLAYARMRNDA